MKEKKAFAINGYLGLIMMIGLVVAGIYLLFRGLEK